MHIHTVVEAIAHWFSNHGWRILLIIIIAGILRRFSLLFITKFVSHNIETSERFENKRDRKLRIDTLVGLADSVLKIAMYVIVGLLILSELNVLKLVAPLLAGAGVLTLLIGFGIQTFVKDFISGIFIVAENQYRVGDVVSLATSAGAGVDGIVTRVTLRTTVIRDNDGAIHFIPNGNIVRAANQTLDYARVNVELALPLNADLDVAERAVSAMGLKMAKEEIWQHRILQAPYYHGVQSFDKDQVIVEIRARTIPAQQWRLSSELQKRLVALLASNNSFAKTPHSSKKK